MASAFRRTCTALVNVTAEKTERRNNWRRKSQLAATATLTRRGDADGKTTPKMFDKTVSGN